MKATLYDNGELIISGKGNAQYARGYVAGDNGGDGYYDGMPWMPRIYGEWIYDYIYKVTIKKGVAPKSIRGWFYDLSRLKQAPQISSGVKYMIGAFQDCKSLKQAPKIPSSVKDMSETFEGCKSLKQAPKIPVGVKDMNDTFYKCKSLKQAPEIPAGVKNMYGTFFDCESLTKGPSSIPSSVENMDVTFRYCKSMTGTIKIKTTLANVTDEDSSYSHCGSCFSDAATDDGCQIRLDYVDEALVDKILEDVSSESHVVKGNYIG